MATAPLQRQGGLTYRDAAPMIAGVVDNGICPDDPRVLVRLNEATKMTLDLLIPVGGMASYFVTAFKTLVRAAQTKIIEAHPVPVPPAAGNPLPGTIYQMRVTSVDFTTLADVEYTVLPGNSYVDVVLAVEDLLRAAPLMSEFNIPLNPAFVYLEHGSDFTVSHWVQIAPPAPSADEPVTTGQAPNPGEFVTGDDNLVVTVGASFPGGGGTLFNRIVIAQTFISEVLSDEPILMLPPQLENCIEAVVYEGKVHGDTDIAQGWYEIASDSVYLDPGQAHDNPLIDRGLLADPNDRSVLRRVYEYPGLTPENAVVLVTGAKRFIPIKNDDDFLIVQNIEALKMMILSIERGENAAPDEAAKYMKMGVDLFQAEARKHLIDPRNYMRRKAAYQEDVATFAENTLGWVRGNIALDVPQAIRTGKIDLTWSINQIERRIMQRGIFKDCITMIQTNVIGGFVYFPVNVGSVLAVNLNGRPIPIRSEFFQHLENGPGFFPVHSMLIDQGDEYFPGTKTTRRKYKLVADCKEGQCLNAVCKLRWLYKKPTDLMVIKNYEAIRLMMTAKFMEEDQKWQEAAASQQQAFGVLEAELRDYLAGIRHTIHIQCDGFGLANVGGVL